MKRDEIREFVKGLLERKDDDAAFGDTDSLVLSGRLDSLDVIDLLTFLETRFGVSMTPESFDQSKLDSIDAVMALLAE